MENITGYDSYKGVLGSNGKPLKNNIPGKKFCVKLGRIADCDSLMACEPCNTFSDFLPKNEGYKKCK